MSPEELKILANAAYLSGALAMQVRVVQMLLNFGHESLGIEILNMKIEHPEALSGTPTLDLSKYKIDQLELSIRSANCLHGARIETLEDLVNKTRKDLLEIKHFGRRSLNEIVDVLYNMGLTLKPDGD